MPALLAAFMVTAAAGGADARIFAQGAGAPPVSFPQEFVGPFSSWMCVQSLASGNCGLSNMVAYGTATGNGSSDDTAAIQAMLNKVGYNGSCANGSGCAPVLYFPAGTYNFNQTLTLKSQLDIALVGQDPANTTLKWTGSTTGASFTGSIATQTGCSTSVPTNCVFTLTTSGVTGTITPGQVISTTTANITNYPVYIVGSLGGGQYKVAVYNQNFFTPITVASEAMSTVNRSMLWLNGISHSQISRLALDGQSNITVGIDESKYDNYDNYFDQLNFHTDDTIKNVAWGVLCGDSGFGGCVDAAFIRNTFSNISAVGIGMRNFNALQAWVWNSAFSNVAVGLSNSGVPAGSANQSTGGNDGGAGNFHVYGSNFIHSPPATSGEDINYGNIQEFNFIGNYSIGANQFLASGGSLGSDFAILQGNIILDTHAPIAVSQSDAGPVVLIDNVIRNATGNTTAPVVTVGAGGRPITDLFSMGNTYTVGTIGGSGACGSPITATATAARCHSVNDQVVSRGTVNPTQPVLPAAPQNLIRTVYEASPTGSGTTCSFASPCSLQQAITSAAGACSNNVAHMQPGQYTSAVTIPANCAVQIIGDGETSQIILSTSGPIVQAAGPSRATLKNLSIVQQGTGDGVEIDGVDASGTGGQVYVEGGSIAGSTSNVVNDIFVDAIDYAAVEVVGTDHGNYYSSANPSILVTGGAHGGSFSQYVGESFAYTHSFTGAANGYLDGVWNEVSTAGAPKLINLSGTGSLSYIGGQFGVPYPAQNGGAGPATLDAVTATNFTGNAAFIGLYQGQVCPGAGTCGTWGNFAISGSASGSNVLGLGLLGPSASPSFWLDTTSPSDTNEFLNSQQLNTAQVAEVGAADPTFLTAALARMRAQQLVPQAALPPGRTNAALYNVYISNSRYGLHIKN